MSRLRHDDNLLFLCTAGEGQLETAAGSEVIKPGDAVLLKRGEAHSYRADPKNAWSLYWVHFLGCDAEAFVKHLRGDDGPRIHTGVEPTLLAAFQQIIAIRSSGYSLDAYVATANRLRHLIAECALCRDRQRQENVGNIDLALLQAFMRERVRSKLTLSELAAFSGLTPAHFANRYRAETGYPPIRHFMHMKIEAACGLLDSTSQSVKAIAAYLGYQDPLYFSRVFRQTVGISPTQYRESLRR